MKFLIFRCEENAPSKKGELVGVEYGAAIQDVVDNLVRAINDDLAARPENRGCEIFTYPPDTLGSTMKTMQSQTVPNTVYEFTGVVAPVYAAQNTVYPYMVEIREES